jgi:hypothetical protein
MSLMPWRRGSAGMDVDDTQPGSSGSTQVTWAEAVMRAVALGWPETIRLCVVLLVMAIAGAGCHALATWLGTLL